jgi:hypothetical protein
MHEWIEGRTHAKQHGADGGLEGGVVAKLGPW